jgi:hypothetical protein
MTEDDVEAFAWLERQRVGIPLPPTDSWRHGSRNRQHLWTHVDSDDATVLPNLFFRQSRDYAGSTGNVEDFVAGC